VVVGVARGIIHSRRHVSVLLRREIRLPLKGFLGEPVSWTRLITTGAVSCAALSHLPRPSKVSTNSPRNLSVGRYRKYRDLERQGKTLARSRPKPFPLRRRVTGATFFAVTRTSDPIEVLVENASPAYADLVDHQYLGQNGWALEVVVPVTLVTRRLDVIFECNLHISRPKRLQETSDMPSKQRSDRGIL
jgi:hypothetical protein